MCKLAAVPCTWRVLCCNTSCYCLNPACSMWSENTASLTTTGALPKAHTCPVCVGPGTLAFLAHEVACCAVTAAASSAYENLGVYALQMAMWITKNTCCNKHVLYHHICRRSYAAPWCQNMLHVDQTKQSQDWRLRLVKPSWVLDTVLFLTCGLGFVQGLALVMSAFRTI